MRNITVEVITLRSALLLHLTHLLAVLNFYMTLLIICVRVLRSVVIASQDAGLMSSNFMSCPNTFSLPKALIQRGLMPEASFSFGRSIIILAAD